MKRYVTKWALSSGIVAVTGEYLDSGKYFSGDGPRGVFVKAAEAHETLEQARACAKEMAKKKAKSLAKQVKALGASTWEPKVQGESV